MKYANYSSGYSFSWEYNYSAMKKKIHTASNESIHGKLHIKTISAALYNTTFSSAIIIKI